LASPTRQPKINAAHQPPRSHRGQPIETPQLARAVDGLALALAQAGAINKQRIGFARYFSLWREKRALVVNWFEKRFVSYNHDVGLATTWVTSVEQLTPGETAHFGERREAQSGSHHLDEFWAQFRLERRGEKAEIGVSMAAVTSRGKSGSMAPFSS
jgi:hypothetical protein